MTVGARRRLERRRLVHEVVLDYLACGLDPQRAHPLPAVGLPEVCELTWILTTIVPMGLLERSHAYKDKVCPGDVRSITGCSPIRC